MKKILKGLMMAIMLAAVGFALIHPYAYSRLEKANGCSCHIIDPKTTLL